ncbi:MAG TPA: phage baseplate assembly protein V [Chloroflexia bacterium]|nr:phage baseplate assembly protein V [Chloroflexia bacterium]
MRQQPGVVIALVKSVDDPSALGRIQVEFPWLSDRNQSAWAPLAVPLAGKKRGMYFLPEVGDEALVAFEHGDLAHPFIIGFLWNGVDKPPNEGIDHSVRRLWTVSGHIMDFDDRDGQEAITITTQGKQKIEMKDNTAAISIALKESGHHIDLKETEGTILIKTKNGQQIELNDQPGKMTLQVMSGNKVTIEPTQVEVSALGSTVKIDASGVTVQAPSGMLNITCASANVTATGAMNVTASSVLNVTAPIATFSGIIQATMVQASAIVGSAYTPGPGNTFGL